MRGSLVLTIALLSPLAAYNVAGAADAGREDNVVRYEDGIHGPERADLVAVAPPTGTIARIKDIARFAQARDNQLVGYGLVIGLSGTGDSARSTPFMVQSLRAMLTRLGIAQGDERAQVRNVAAVAVTATLPPFARPGSTVDVTVSSIGDATSLRGGTLIATALTGGNEEVYAVAQGSLLVAGVAAAGEAQTVTQGVPTSGKVPGGAIVEGEPPAELVSSSLRLQLRNPDFSTAVAISDAINAISTARFDVPTARARDAANVDVITPPGIATPRFIALIERLEVPTDAPARVVLDERSGTVVIGAKVKISRVAVTHGTLTVRVTEQPRIVQPNPFSDGQTAVETATRIDASQPGGNLTTVDGPSLEGLVSGLNALGVRPGDTIAILQAIRRAGALQAELVVQ